MFLTMQGIRKSFGQEGSVRFLLETAEIGG